MIDIEPVPGVNAWDPCTTVKEPSAGIREWRLNWLDLPPEWMSWREYWICSGRDEKERGRYNTPCYRNDSGIPSLSTHKIFLILHHGKIWNRSGDRHASHSNKLLRDAFASWDMEFRVMERYAGPDPWWWKKPGPITIKPQPLFVSHLPFFSEYN